MIFVFIQTHSRSVNSFCYCPFGVESYYPAFRISVLCGRGSLRKRISPSCMALKIQHLRTRMTGKLTLNQCFRIWQCKLPATPLTTVFYPMKAQLVALRIVAYCISLEHLEVMNSLFIFDATSHAVNAS